MGLFFLKTFAKVRNTLSPKLNITIFQLSNVLMVSATECLICLAYMNNSLGCVDCLRLKSVYINACVHITVLVVWGWAG